MSLRRKVINRRKLKELNKALKKENLTEFNQEKQNILPPRYKKPSAKKKKKKVAEMGSLKWLWEGVTDTQMKRGWIRTKPGAPAEFKWEIQT